MHSAVLEFSYLNTQCAHWCHLSTSIRTHTKETVVLAWYIGIHMYVVVLVYGDSLLPKPCLTSPNM